jgi:hypothetical protein
VNFYERGKKARSNKKESAGVLSLLLSASFRIKNVIFAENLFETFTTTSLSLLLF